MSPRQKAHQKLIEAIEAKYQAMKDAEIAQAELNFLDECPQVAGPKDVTEFEEPISHRKAAKLIGCTTETITKAIKGESGILLTAKEVGDRSWLISPRDLAAWLVQKPKLCGREKAKKWLHTRQGKTAPM